MAGTYVRSYFIITIVYSFKNALHMMLYYYSCLCVFYGYFSMTKISCYFLQDILFLLHVMITSLLL
jgi:hypothetical protein